jgi:hypothetical protein
MLQGDDYLISNFEIYWCLLLAYIREVFVQKVALEF